MLGIGLLDVIWVEGCYGVGVLWIVVGGLLCC